MSHVLSREVTPAFTVTIRAVLAVDWLSLRCERSVNWIGILRRRNIQKPVFDSFDARQINGDRSHAGSQCRALVSFFDGRIVAVPMQLHAFALSLLPDRWQVDGADDF